MLTLKIWMYIYSITIALTACESTKRDLIKIITGEGGQDVHCEILLSKYQKNIWKLQ